MFLGILLAVMGVLASAAFVEARVQTSVGLVSDCGYSTSCYATGSGIVVSVSVNATVVRSNGSLSFSVSLSNPTDHSVNISVADSWYLSGLSESATCGYAPYAYEVFRGYYNLTDVSTGQNVLRTIDPGCISIGRPTTTFSFPPKSSCVYWCTFGQLYATDGGTGKQGDVYIGGVTSLWSSQPGVYTMVAGDEWGAFVILHFSVVPDGPSPT